MAAIREWGKGLMSAVLVVALLLLQTTLAHSSVLSGRVVAVADGDTITVLDSDKRQHRVRLAGIDAPEKAQPYGQASKHGLSDLVFGRNVDVHWSKEDQYGRLVGNVRVADVGCKAATCPKAVDAGYEQLRTGLAWWFRRYAHEQPKDEVARYEAAEQSARAGKLGLWKEAAPVPPWEWRKG
jgi:endonuclease YncB( thermonuclease family)